MPGWSHHSAVQQRTAGDLSVEVIMPDSGLIEGQTVRVVFGMAVTTLTWTSTDGKTILNAPTSVTAGTVVTLVWSIAIGSWVIFQ
jgi:hypothetical protein